MSQRLNKHLKAFLPSASGESSVQLAAFFGALAVLVALVSTPFLDKASKQFAENQSFGVDPVVTSSVKKPKRYTIRKSVLDNQKNPYPQ